MSGTQDLCDGVATLESAVRRYEAAPEGERAQAWMQVRRAVGYMRTMAAWKEHMSPAEVLAQGVAATDLDARWDMDHRSSSWA